ncbi:MAG TPA: POTRA domain-containing protein, partial [Caulobacteraceae bacterium]
MSVLAAGAALALPCAAVAAPKAEVRGDLPDDLRDRVERAVGDTDDAADNRFQARRRARSAAEDAEAVLRSEGYYGAIIAQDVEGDEAPRAVLTITPGARFLIVSPTLEWTGDTPEAGPAAMAQEAMALIPGSPGRAAEVLAAEGRVVASLTANGYADAVAGDRTVTVDHAATTLQPTFRIVAGQLVILNGVSLRTRGPTNLAWVERLAPWRPGDRYTTESVGELERRLLETGVYDSVAVSLAPVNEATPDGRRPIIVSLSDRPRRILEAGVGVSTSEGFGVDAIWTWYNRFGRADTLRFEFRLAQINSRIGSELSLPHWRRPGRTLKLGAALFDEDTDAYD